MNDHPIEGFTFFLNNLTIKALFIHLLPTLYRSLPTKDQGYVPCGTIIIV